MTAKKATAKKATAKKATAKKAAPAARSTGRRVGTVVKASRVVRPDGTAATVSGGFYVLDVAGTFTVDGKTIKVVDR